MEQLSKEFSMEMLLCFIELVQFKKYFMKKFDLPLYDLDIIKHSTNNVLSLPNSQNHHVHYDLLSNKKHKSKTSLNQHSSSLLQEQMTYAPSLSKSQQKQLEEIFANNH